MATTPLISDAELLAMGIASDALGAIPSGERDAARAVASSFALSFLRKRFTMPLTAVSDDVKRAVAHVCSYDLLSRRGFAAIGNDESITDRYLEACKWLEKVAKGTVEPENVQDSTPLIADAGPIVASDGPALWGPYGSRYGRRRC